MRIALVFEFGTLNGGEHSMLALIDATRREDLDYTALAPALSPLHKALESRGIPTVPFNVRSQSGQRRPREDVLAELRAILLGSDCDLVHANSLSMGRLTGAIAADLPIPCTAHLRDILKLTKATIAELNQNTRLVAVSEATRAFHLAQGLQAERVQTIYNGVDCQRFQRRISDGAIRRELGVLPADFLVLNVGQIGLRKGQDVLAEAAARLVPRLPSAKYVLAGQRCSDKPESREFERNLFERLHSLGDGDGLRVLGYREDMPELMNAADVLVHAAHQEPLGRVLLEAAASGLPIIATDVGGTPEILHDRESALLVPPNDAKTLATAIAKLAGDAALRKQLAANARAEILDKFTIQQAAKNLASFWKSVVLEHTSRGL